MARKARETEEPNAVALRNAIIAGIKQHLDKHLDEALVYADEAENKTIAVGFTVKIDMSKGEPIVEVKIRFSQSVTDEVKYTMDDPNQGTFQVLTDPVPTPEPEEPEGEPAEG